jgi:hypothetical protein
MKKLPVTALRQNKVLPIPEGKAAHPRWQRETYTAIMAVG